VLGGTPPASINLRQTDDRRSKLPTTKKDLIRDRIEGLIERGIDKTDAIARGVAWCSLGHGENVEPTK
jgi:hypothetical protein